MRQRKKTNLSEGKQGFLLPLQAVQEIHLLRGVCIDENQHLQSKGRLWP